MDALDPPGIWIMLLFVISHSCPIDFVNNSIEIQKATNEDIDQIRMLFFETINHVNIKDYNSSQVEVWSAGYNNISGWRKKLLGQYFVVAKINAVVVGFASITPDGCLDYNVCPPKLSAERHCL